MRLIVRMTLQRGSFLAPVAIRAKLNNEGRLVCPGNKANRKREFSACLVSAWAIESFPVLPTSTQIALDYDAALESEPQRAKSDMNLQYYCTALSSSRRSRMIFTASLQELFRQVQVRGDTTSSETGITTDRIVHVVRKRTKNVKSRTGDQSDLVYIPGRSDLD
jgi:hypothetical protein